MLRFVSFYRFLGWSFVAGLFGTGLLAASFYLYLTPNLPDVEQLRHTQLQIPLRIFSSDDKLIAEFGEKRRSPITIDQVPTKLSQAFIAAEDNRFYEHHGVDIKGLLRAATQLATSGKIQSGGSTITMQVAKNFFLSREKTFTRKFNEILLALQIEQELSKDEILELYFNKIYLGNRAYGIEAASQVYYGKPVAKLTLAEMAMIAGLPKAPSRYNPIANPSRALIRRDWILDRMLDLGFIDASQHLTAKDTPITAVYHGSKPQTEAPYLAEMARKELVEKYGDEAYSEGFNVYLTVNSTLQEAANKAVQKGLEAYDQRHGYRGPEQTISIDGPFADENISTTISNMTNYGDLVIAAVKSVKEDEATLLTKDHGEITLDLNSVKWARPFISINRLGAEPKTVTDVLSPGDIVRVKQTKEHKWMLAQTPKVQGTLVSIEPSTGAIKALVGGYDFAQSKYNRALQAERQPGSNFKPFIYLAALESGSTAATLINDAPIVFEDKNLEASWRPENSSGKFFGPTRLRTALYKSRNLVSIRLLKKTGIRTTRNFVSRFGFDSEALPNDLSLALGSAGVTPMQIATGYSSIANGGYKTTPYFIERIEDSKGDIIFQATPSLTPSAIAKLKNREATNRIELIANVSENKASEVSTTEAGTTEDNYEVNGDTNDSISALTPVAPSYYEAESIIDARTIYIMHSILKDVIIRGTGRKAKALKRSDLAGKTGTTNDQKDAWFSGFNTDTETTVWVGFDQPSTLGRREYGATAALPIWIDYMRVALANTPSATMKQPEGLVTVKINTETGKLAKVGEQNTVFEIFRKENAPQPENIPTSSPTQDSPSTTDDIITAEDIF
ncbi:penicillin-binding protein 1A [Alkalimarinus sediminis]|uniref:Penicillin-binding protein 1A n=1 Tax=Alkalimarinus sediminis TaxID=1632866 RepID=A0A9E8HFZ1_9ALTE|nr:penicillin-binding protein 1A [Alkalimarinus sediminis]UZW73935.1 penicillin-binding protein 1A [Alkalimarinus sediminis]